MDDAIVGKTNTDSKTIAIIVHIGGIFFSWLVPLIIYLVKKNSGDQFSTNNAREALNFQITILFWYFTCFILSFVLIGLFMFWIIALGNLILGIIAAVKASDGITYRYPMTIRLIK